MTFLLAAGALAQSVVIPSGKIAVFKAGDNTGIWNISSSKVQPCFVQVFDTATQNQSAPLYSLSLPTNQPNGVWINAHAGTEGGGISRTTSRQFLALEGYTGNILSPTAAKPSADPSVERGIATVDAFGNEMVIYQDLANWFGLPPGVTQNNPTGIASTDGTNFWGTGSVTGTSSEAAGTLYYNANVAPTPLELQNYIQAAGEARIIGGSLYIVVAGQGVYNFLDPLNNDVPVPLPFDPDVPNPVQHIVLTNLFLNFGATFKNVADFDMNPQGTIAYGADQSLGIVKFTNFGGVWSQAPYFFSPTNLGTTAQTSGNRGCFGICVDFSSANPVIYATTMENGQVPNSQGNPNNNRLIRIVDTGVSPGSAVVAQTLATAQTTNENFRGIDFTPDLGPQIDSQPANYATTNGGTATFTVVADAVYPLNYQWQSNGVSIGGTATNASLALSSLNTGFNGYTYQCVVSDTYGSVTSTPALLTVTALPVAPAITNVTQNIVAFINGTVTFPAITPTGTEPFTFQWYHGTTQLVDDGVKYFGSLSNSLTVANLASTDAGSYYLVAANAAGTASNLVESLTVNFHKPVINAGLPPALTTTFVGLNVSIAGTQTGGTPPITNQWFKGATSTTVTNPAMDGGTTSGSQTDTLTFTSASLTNAGFYKLVVSNPAGFVTSTVAQVQVLVPPPLSSASYSNQVYVQTFDSLPDPGTNSVNSFNNPNDPGSLNGVVYSLANPFDFAFPVINNNFVGGLGLSNTMPGWYGAADTLFPGVDGITRFGAQDGDQTTGGVIDFGPNDAPGALGTNRALGLLSTGTTGSTTFALKLINTSGATLNYASLGFIGELWHNGTGTRTMSVGFTVDNTANSFTLTPESISNSTYIPSLAFSFPTALVVTAVDGTSPAYQTNLSVTNVPVGAWSPGGALWVIWAIDYYGSGGGNGYAIDNLNFYATANPAAQPVSQFAVNTVSYTPGSGPTPSSVTLNFTNVPGVFSTVLFATNLTPPVNWQPLGQPTEVPQGAYSSYSFTDSHATNGTRFYQIVSP
jgi:hypothetical protein